MRFCFLNSENWALTFPVGNQMPAAVFTPFSRLDADSLTHTPPTPPPAPEDLWTIRRVPRGGSLQGPPLRGSQFTKPHTCDELFKQEDYNFSF